MDIITIIHHDSMEQLLILGIILGESELFKSSKWQAKHHRTLNSLGENSVREQVSDSGFVLASRGVERSLAS